MLKKVLFISYDGITDPLGRSQVLPYLQGLAARGHHIYILSLEKNEAHKESGEEIRKLLEESNIKWHSTSFGNSIPGWSAFRNYRRLKQLAMKIVKSDTIDLVHCRSYIPAILGLFLKRTFGCKMIFDMRGFWADERVEGNLWPMKNPLYKMAYRFFKKKEKELLSCSDAVISLTNLAKSEIMSWQILQISSEKITVIPCCADLDFFSEKKIDPEEKRKWSALLGINEHDFILSYSGSLGTWYLLREMLQFFKILLIHKPTAKFLFITHEPKEAVLHEAQKLEIPVSRIMVIAGTRKQMPVLLSLSAVSVFFIKPSFSKSASSPTKMGEILSLGIPVIGNSGVGDVDEIISSSQLGYVVKNFMTAEFEKCIDQLNQLLNIPAEVLRAGAIRYFNLETGINKYHHIYSNL